MKIAVVTDSNSCITQKQAKEMGVFAIPMPFMIDGEEFFEDINITQEGFFEKIENGANVVTSQPSPETVMNLWDNILKEYDQIVHIPMSSGLSGACQTANMLAEDYDGKVFVVDNQRICPTLRDSVWDALNLINKGYDGAQIKKILEENRAQSTIYIMVGTLDYLKKGGRITPAVAAIGSILKIKPVLSIHGDKLDAFGMARTVNSGKQTMMNAVKHDLENLLHNVNPDDYYVAVAYTKDNTDALKFKEDLKEMFPNTEISVDPLSLSVACHIGPSALAIAVSEKIK